MISQQNLVVKKLVDGVKKHINEFDPYAQMRGEKPKEIKKLNSKNIKQCSIHGKIGFLECIECKDILKEIVKGGV